MILEGLFAALYVFQIVLTLWSLAQVRRFVEETPVIADDRGLGRYRAFVRVQMHLALVVLALMLPGLLLTMMLVVRHGMTGLAIVLGVNACLFALGRYHKTWEVRARSLDVSTEALRPEYRRVSETWVKKPLPDF